MTNKMIKKNNLKISPELKNVIPSWLDKPAAKSSGALESARPQSYGNAGPIQKATRIVSNHKNTYALRKGHM